MSLRKATLWAVSGSAGALIALLSGCSSGNTSIGPGANTTSQLRSVNALVCTTYNKVDFAQRISTAILATGVAYSQATAYSTVPAGNGINDYAVHNGTTVAQASYDLHPDGIYTLVAAGDCSQTNTSGVAPAVYQYTDNILSSAQLGGNVGLRVIHVAPVTTAGYQSVDLYNSGQPLVGLTNIAYGGASGYATVPAGTYNLSLHSHANNNLLTLPSYTATALGSLKLTAGHSYTLFLVGTTSGVPNEAFDVLVVQDK